MELKDPFTEDALGWIEIYDEVRVEHPKEKVAEVASYVLDCFERSFIYRNPWEEFHNWVKK